MGKNTQSKKAGSGSVRAVKTVRMFSAGGVVFKVVKGQKDKKTKVWLVRKTAASDLYPKQYWMLPKGWIDNKSPHVPGPMASGEIKADEVSLQKTALREVAEETGVEAKIIKKLGTSFYSYLDPKFGKTLKFVTFYLMEWANDLLEGYDSETAEILWLPYDEAYKKLSFSSEKEMLKKAQSSLRHF